jgi:hypothetical protein
MATCLAALVILAGPAALTAQEPLPLGHFDDWETWPLHAPGDLATDDREIVPLRIEFEGQFPGPNGFGSPPLDSLTMFMDVLELTFRGSPALWIQWLSSPPRERTSASPALDALLVDRVTFRLLFRLAASQRGEWAGRYEIVQARPDRVVQVSVDEDGTTIATEIENDAAGLFDFATYQFLFPFLELREGDAFRLSGYEYIEKRAEILPVRVVGRTRVKDAFGRDNEVWQVDIMPEHRQTLISFYVTREPPYFYGWDYRLTRDGTMAIQLRLRGWTRTSKR